MGLGAGAFNRKGSRRTEGEGFVKIAAKKQLESNGQQRGRVNSQSEGPAVSVGPVTQKRGPRAPWLLKTSALTQGTLSDSLPDEEGRGGGVTCPQGTRHSPSSSHTHYLLGCPTEHYCGKLERAS